MKTTIGDKVILSLSAEQIEYELANLEDLEAILLMKLKDPQDRKELRDTFDVAKTAMQMVWLNMNGEQFTAEDLATLKKAVMDEKTKKWSVPR